MNVYLDSSAIIKRYVDEKGTEIADNIFDKAQSGQLSITYNIINTGEVIGIFDKLNRLKEVSKTQHKDIMENYLGETLRLLDLKTLYVSPCKMKHILDSWNYITKYHLYVVDAIQLTTASEMKADLFISGDKKLVQVAKKLALRGYNIESEQEKIQSHLDRKN